MMSLRFLLVRGFLLLCATLVSLTAPQVFPVALVVAIALLVHDGPESRTTAWTVLWLLVLETTSASAWGTLALPFCLTALFLALMRRTLSLGFWSERTGWSVADAVRSGALAVLANAFAVLWWVLTGVLTGAPAIIGRFSALEHAIVAMCMLTAVALVLARSSSEPLRRPIIFSGT